MLQLQYSTREISVDHLISEVAMNYSLTGTNFTTTYATEDPRMKSLKLYLIYALPILGGIVLPFSAFNVYLLYPTDGRRKPSHLLYMNLLAAGTTRCVET
jgi:hypothetical protein